MYKTNELTGNVYNDSEVTCKVCFLARTDINNVIVSLVLLGLF